MMCGVYDKPHRLGLWPLWFEATSEENSCSFEKEFLVSDKDELDLSSPPIPQKIVDCEIMRRHGCDYNVVLGRTCLSPRGSLLDNSWLIR